MWVLLCIGFTGATRIPYPSKYSAMIAGESTGDVSWAVYWDQSLEEGA